MWLKLTASNKGNAFDVVTGLESVSAGLGASVNDEERNQVQGEADLPANFLYCLPFAIHHFDPAMIVKQLLAVWL
jgi:hypothetical protein